MKQKWRNLYSVKNSITSGDKWPNFRAKRAQLKLAMIHSKQSRRKINEQITLVLGAISALGSVITLGGAQKPGCLRIVFVVYDHSVIHDCSGDHSGLLDLFSSTG